MDGQAWQLRLTHTPIFSSLPRLPEVTSVHVPQAAPASPPTRVKAGPLATDSERHHSCLSYHRSSCSPEKKQGDEHELTLGLTCVEELRQG